MVFKRIASVLLWLLVTLTSAFGFMASELEIAPSDFFCETIDYAESETAGTRNLCRENGWLNYDTTSGCCVAANKVTRKPIIVGENMKRVQQYADEVGGHAYRPWKNDPFDFDLGMRRNERWIRDQMRDGREIIDIGPDFQRRSATGRNSPFYEMERRNLDG